MKILQLCLLFIAVPAAFCVLGFDISYYQGAVSQETFTCMKNKGYDFAIIQAWIGGYNINKNYVQNWKNAKAAGIKYVDIYVFACNNCKNNNPATIVASIKATLPSGFDGMLWIDVEPCTNCWLDNDSNLQFVNNLATTAKAAGFNVGIYSCIWCWENTFGSRTASTATLKSLPLWYAHFDNQTNFNDGGYNFGGYTKPSIKQFNDHPTADCNLEYDSDWYPNAEEFDVAGGFIHSSYLESSDQ